MEMGGGGEEGELCVMGIMCQLLWTWSNSCIELVYLYSLADTNCTVNVRLLLGDIQ
jgi:hypothetical protein